MSVCPRCKETVMGRQSTRPCPVCRDELGMSEPSGRARRGGSVRKLYRQRLHPGKEDGRLMAANKARPTVEQVRARLMGQGEIAFGEEGEDHE